MIVDVLKTAYSLPDDRLGRAYTNLMDSAEQVGFFDARGGVRTHLVRPSPARSFKTESHDDGEGSQGGGSGDGFLPPTPSAPTTKEQVRLEYIRKLISMLDKDGADFDKLNEMIQKMLNETD